jgi:hypothetical protein
MVLEGYSPTLENEIELKNFAEAVTWIVYLKKLERLGHTKAFKERKKRGAKEKS